MSKGWLAVLVVAMAAAFVSETADAKRLGGGRPAGMQRTAPDKPTPATPATPNNAQNAAPGATPNAPAAPAAAAAPANAGAAAAAAPKRSWLGPVAGLAAGLGLAALFSHLGLGEELANFMMLMLLAIVAVVAIRWLLRRFAGSGAGVARPALAGATAGSAAPLSVPPLQRAASSSGTQPIVLNGVQAAATPHLALPAGFDAAAFERVAKMIFIRLQAANDKSDVGDLRAFTTPELFSALRLDLQERGAAAQQTDVVTLDADLLDFAQENDRQIVSVRFHGLIREETDGGAQPFDEVWHLVRPAGGDGGSWAIAGIQPRQ